MSITHTFRMGWGPGSSMAIDKSVEVSSDAEDNQEVTAVGSGTNGGITQVLTGWTVAAMKAIYIFSDGALTLKTNSSSAPDDTITIAANTPFVWFTGSGIDSPFTATVTSFYFVNASATARNVKIRILKDTTP